MNSKFLRKSIVFLIAVSVLSIYSFGASFFMTAEDMKSQSSSKKLKRKQTTETILKTIPEGQEYVQYGDMRFRVSTLKRSGFTGTKWTGGKVYYQFATGVTSTQQEYWKEAAATWTAVANLEFIEGTGIGNYISVKNSTGNWSYVGMIGGKQEMGIFNWTYKFIIAHEIGHALGLAHEQSRQDRDSYVTILWDNIESGYENNFNKESTTDYGDYDFDSVMHYTKDAFSKNGNNTIEPQPAYSEYLDVMGQHTHLSDLDKSGMAERYGTGSATITVTSPNGGETYQRGTTQTVSWDYSGTVSAVNISLYQNGSSIATLASNESNDGSYSWTISDSLEGTGYTIEVADVDGKASDTSDSPFTILSTPVPLSITVTSPNGGEKWKRGTSQTITWTSTGEVENVAIYLYKDGVLDSTLSTKTADSGSYGWFVPVTKTIGDGYSVTIVCSTDDTVSDSSDASFEIIEKTEELEAKKIAVTLRSDIGGKDKVSLVKGSWPVSTDPDSVWLDIGGWRQTFTDFSGNGTTKKSVIEGDDGSVFKLTVDTKNNVWSLKGTKATLFDDISVTAGELNVTTLIGATYYSHDFTVDEKTAWKFKEGITGNVDGVITTMTTFNVLKASGKYQSTKTDKGTFKINKGEIALTGDITVATDTVTIQLDSMSLGPYTLTQKNEAKKIYSYKSENGTTPGVKLKIDLEKGFWSLAVSKADTSSISGPEVDVVLTIGTEVGAQKITTTQKTKYTYTE